jgi:hypothetical protein
MFRINQQFNAVGVTGKIVFIKNWNTGLLAGCQLVHVMMNNNPADIWRVFKWNDNTLNRITRLKR